MRAIVSYPLSDSHEMANNLLRLLGSLLKSNDGVQLSDQNIHAYFCMALVWSVGATVDAPGRMS